ncbi:helix-turn-helix domain-containing protein [Peptoniphilus vaginalis]|uniref:helix-turn-helix domain-containing protein n=1 Tax=Peptoniphilus vaginalis TaxID=1756987 RepID=UPI0023FA47AA|nr:helix-turn-helix domain-containing protein [Peptoniphilus vaginalis]
MKKLDLFGIIVTPLRMEGAIVSNFFVNDKFKVLECMEQRQIQVNDESIVKLSQQEIADILGFTKTKVNNIVRELKENGYLTQLSSRGKYILTDIANEEINKMKGEEVKK